MPAPTCPICGSETPPFSSVDTPPSSGVNCPRCGLFAMTLDAVFLGCDNWTARQKANLSSWVREHQNERITMGRLQQLKGIPTPSYGERKRKLLLFFQQHSKTLGQYMDLDPRTMDALIASTWCEDSREAGFLLGGLEIDALAEKRAGSQWRLTAKSYDYLAQLDVNPASQIGFCAMWFDETVSFLWDKAIEQAIRDAGYQPLRIDRKEHLNRIDDEIFADIRRSRFVIADFTHGENGVRGGVYFEAGFAQGLGLPVIWTCREDILSEDKLHFDIRQYNFLEWAAENLDDFKDRLQKRIEANLGRGSWKPE